MLAERGENSRGEQRRACEKKFGVGAPSITLSTRGGAISGTGEKFAANPATGAGSMTVPFVASRAGVDFGPQHSVYYDSGVSNEPFAFRSSASLPWTGTGMATPTPSRISRDNATTAYGLDASSYVADPADPSEIFSYRACRSWPRNARTLRRRGEFFKTPPPSLSGEQSGFPLLPLSDFSTYGNML